jgi:transcriptional/translational regulatory protein YebC/TACO1
VREGRKDDMSGHSKWATTKYRKGAQDKARAKIFAKHIRSLEVAAREGGGDINTNASLRSMYQKARDVSLPLDTIERAITTRAMPPAGWR